MADIIHEIKERRILPSVGVYAGSCWVLVEIIDRLVERYLLSPYVTDIAFWGLYSLIPAVILIAWTHGRPGKDEITTLEKVGVPINVIASLGLLLTLFGDKNLGVAADLVLLSNEEGRQESHYVAKEAFRRRLAVFFFDNNSGNPDLDWIQYGVTELLVQDLNESPFLNAASPWTNYGNGFYARMRQAGFNDGLDLPKSLMREITDDANRQYFVSGSINKNAEEYVITASLWDARTVAEVATLTERDWDFYTAADSLSERLRKALEVPQSDGRMSEDLPLSETYGESLEAFRFYIAGLNARLFDNNIEESTSLLEQSLQYDQGFVRSWYALVFNHADSGDLPSAQQALSKAQELDYRLPATDRATVKHLNYRLSGQVDKQIAFLKMQVSLRDDAQSHATLAGTLMASGQLEESKQHFLAALERDPMNLGIYLQLATLEKGLGNMEGAIGFTREYLDLKPNDAEAQIRMGDFLRDNGDLEAAETHYDQASLFEDQAVTSTLKKSLLAMRKGDEPGARQMIEEAEHYSVTAAQKAQVRATAEYLEYRLGRVNEAIKQLNRRREFLQESLPPFQIAVTINSPMVQYYVDLGKTQRAREVLAETLEFMQPPLDQFLAFSEASILIEEDNLESAEQAIGRGLEIIDQFQLEELKFQADFLYGLLEFKRGNYEQSAAHLQDAMVRIEHSVLVGSDVNLFLPKLYGIMARSQVYAGQYKEAEKTLEKGFEQDPAEPGLWLARARLQHKSGLSQLALASANYALAIWYAADTDFLYYRHARKLAEEIQATL